jgi:GNAT superfamily N-acetyltransferase
MTTITSTGTTVILLSERHRELLHVFRHQTEVWLAGKGEEQYNGIRAPQAHAHIDRLLDDRCFWGLADGDAVVAVGALTGPDMDFWTPAEVTTPASYLARFMVAEHGHDYGGQLLDALAELARENGRRHLRLDCWRTNHRLQRYYLDHGFRHVRTMEVVGRMSGALFEMDLCRSRNVDGPGTVQR